MIPDDRTAIETNLTSIGLEAVIKAIELGHVDWTTERTCFTPTTGLVSGECRFAGRTFVVDEYYETVISIKEVRA